MQPAGAGLLQRYTQRMKAPGKLDTKESWQGYYPTSGSKRKYDILLVWALDRLSRGGAAAILNLVDTFKASGVKVVSLQESWMEAPGAIGEILYSITGWVARMESERRSERTKAGLARAGPGAARIEGSAGGRDTSTGG